ncbi:MAG: hypothetical protein VX822_00480 [Candidatus Neomarinimicrobiota bacterium]|nr:hypothetical protein [Candidatus Neomarinimicrobiota bacterium]
MQLLLTVLPAFLFLFSGCGTVHEYRPVEISLANEFTVDEPEYSGMAWAGQNLVILPQFPDRFPGSQGGNLLSIPKKRIEDYLTGKDVTPIIPNKIAFNDNRVLRAVPGFEGFEALFIDGNSVFLTIEAKEGEGRRGYIVSGTADWKLGKVHLNRLSLKQIRFDLFMPQMSFESLILWKNSLVAIYEANGRPVSDSPEAAVFDRELNQLQNLPFPSVEYRITDATAVAPDETFWIINYFYPREERLRPEVDPIADRYGQGPTHTTEETVERLLQLSFHEDGLLLVERPPVQLSLMEGKARNWEGIVRLDDRGFLLISDTYPRTIFSFVPLGPE